MAGRKDWISISEPDRLNRTGRTGQSERDRQNRTSRMEQAEQDRLTSTWIR
jgi:hypothetical protein